MGMFHLLLPFLHLRNDIVDGLAGVFLGYRLLWRFLLLFLHSRYIRCRFGILCIVFEANNILHLPGGRYARFGDMGRYALALLSFSTSVTTRIASSNFSAGAPSAMRSRLYSEQARDRPSL